MLLAQAVADISPLGPHETLATSIASVAAAIILFVIRTWFADKKAYAVQKIDDFIKVAYWATNNFARFTSTKVDDKAAHAMEILRQQLSLQGIEWTPAIQAQAKASFDAMHAQEKVLGVASSPFVGAPSDLAIREGVQRELSRLGVVKSVTLPSSP